MALNIISHCEGKFNWKSHNTSYCLIEVVTKAGLLYLQVEKLIEWTDISLKIAALVNFLVFLQRGVYHSLLERVLGIQPVFPDKQGIRQVNYNDSSSIIFYPALFLFEQSNRIDWINFCYICMLSSGKKRYQYRRFLHRGHHKKLWERYLFLLFLDNLTVFRAHFSTCL